MLKIEKSLEGIVCGIDEAGRGPLAGPVTAASVYILPETSRKRFWAQVNDSKTLPHNKREELFTAIVEHSCYGIAQACNNEIDQLNIHHATLLAMKRAFETMCRNFDLNPHHALIDGKFSPKLACNTMTVIKGDSKSRSIAAASILAKVTRDRIMTDLHEQFPHYGWIKNAGYGTPEHLEGIKLYGVTIHHRQSFAPIKQKPLI